MTLRMKGVEGQVLIDFLVLPDGAVTSAHAVENSQPEFAAAAVAAVSQWTFKPGLLGGRAVTTRMRIPIKFSLSGPKPEPINFVIGRIEETVNMQTGSRGVIIHLAATGPNASQVQAGRFILTQAQDDTGAALEQDSAPVFHQASVGGVAESTSREPISITLMGLSKKARTLRLVDGKLELFLPAQDPAATVTVGNVSSQFGIPLADPALKKAGVALVIYDKATAEKLAAAKNPAGPQEYDTGPIFGSDYLDPKLTPAEAVAMKEAGKAASAAAGPAFAELMRKMNEMGEQDIGIGRQDPNHCIVGLEFQAGDGSALSYSHNGRYHSERESEKKGFDLYNLRSPLPAGARLVCWLLTEKSVVPVPVKFTDLPLPESRFPSAGSPQAKTTSEASPSPKA
jgi:TonB family protein